MSYTVSNLVHFLRHSVDTGETCHFISYRLTSPLSAVINGESENCWCMAG